VEEIQVTDKEKVIILVVALEEIRSFFSPHMQSMDKVDWLRERAGEALKSIGEKPWGRKTT
jgi:hypothetical protein